ncbi:hypothetical protein ACF073_04145 [Streptomyces sp. NPDC015171]|uniref:hypothetical protein n=1 Tax=Streptomyces sp. NPDC015171 TaxID=3364945 RepID=UPI0036FD889E
MRLPRRPVVLLTTLATLVGVNMLISTPAQAATSCSGTITYSENIPYPATGEIVGQLTIYYNSSNGGTNSACFQHRGPAYGVATETFVHIIRCSEKSGEGQLCHGVDSDTDEGKYAYQAGPVGVTGTANYCVAAVGSITWRGVTLGRYDAKRRGC